MKLNYTNAISCLILCLMVIYMSYQNYTLRKEISDKNMNVIELKMKMSALYRMKNLPCPQRDSVQINRNDIWRIDSLVESLNEDLEKRRLEIKKIKKRRKFFAII